MKALVTGTAGFIGSHLTGSLPLGTFGSFTLPARQTSTTATLPARLVPVIRAKQQPQEA